MHVQDNLAAYESMVEDEVVDHERQVADMIAQAAQAKKLGIEENDAKIEDADGDVEMMQ